MQNMYTWNKMYKTEVKSQDSNCKHFFFKVFKKRGGSQRLREEMPRKIMRRLRTDENPKIEKELDVQRKRVRWVKTQ